jgi:Response regulator receiver domain
MFKDRLDRYQILMPKSEISLCSGDSGQAVLPGGVANCRFVARTDIRSGKVGRMVMEVKIYTICPAVLGDIKIILEDHPDPRSFPAEFLNQHGAKVLATPDAFDGPQAVKQFRPDMLLSDIYPPTRDGFEVLRDIRELRLSIATLAA